LTEFSDERCRGCAGPGSCERPWRKDCGPKIELRELRLLDVLQAKQHQSEALELERDLRDARRLVKEAAKK
jgi:hypothetical protein